MWRERERAQCPLVVFRVQMPHVVAFKFSKPVAFALLVLSARIFFGLFGRESNKRQATAREDS
jgi:hypothetical protein